MPAVLVHETYHEHTMAAHNKHNPPALCLPPQLEKENADLKAQLTPTLRDRTSINKLLTCPQDYIGKTVGVAGWVHTARSARRTCLLTHAPYTTYLEPPEPITGSRVLARLRVCLHVCVEDAHACVYVRVCVPHAVVYSTPACMHARNSLVHPSPV